MIGVRQQVQNELVKDIGKNDKTQKHFKVHSDTCLQPGLFQSLRHTSGPFPIYITK